MHSTVSSLSAVSVDPFIALREATRSLHDALDQNLPIASEDATIGDYANHLRVIGDWHASLSPWLSRSVIDPQLGALIESDLLECGKSGTALEAIDVSALTQADDGSDAFCWGIAYVVEGSRLGGQVLFKRLQTRLAPHPLRYLGERRSSGLSWSQFMNELRSKVHSEAAVASACNGAIAAFTTLLNRFMAQQVLPHLNNK